MVANRWGLPVVLAAGLASLPACVTNFVSEPVESPPTTLKKAPSEFGMYPRAPGERVALHPEAKPELVSPLPPAEPPEVSPPVAIAAPPFDPPLVRAVRAYLDNQPDVAIQVLRSLDPASQDLLLQLLPVVVQVSQVSLGKAPPHEVMVLSGQLDKAASGVAAKAPLMIDKVCFCVEVETFGRYRPLPNQQVHNPGRIAMLYAEVRNVPSEPAIDPKKGEGYVTRLVRTIELRDAAGGVIELTDRDGKRVAKLQDTKQDFSRSPLRDYFVVFFFETPSKPGTYTVTVEVRDPQSGRAVSKPTSFRVQ